MPAERTPIEPRRGSKPLVEKKRRARINQSLAELQALVVDTKKKQGCKQARVEKADILEMTVRYLQSLQKQQKEEYYHNRFTKFRAGYLECVEEVKRFLTTARCKDLKSLDERLRSHLMVQLPREHAKKEQHDCGAKYNEPKKRKRHVKTMDEEEDSQSSSSSKVTTTTPTTPSPPSPSSSRSTLSPPASSMSPTSSGLPIDATTFQSTTFVIPSSLHTGQLAFVVPTAQYLQHVAKSLMVTRDATSSQMANLDVRPSQSSPSSPHLISSETAIDLCLTPQLQGTIKFKGHQEPTPMLQEVHYGHPQPPMWRPW